MPRSLRFLKFSVYAILIGLFMGFFPKASATDVLINPRDVISNKYSGSFAQHSIRFGLPVASPKVIATDVISIDLSYFSGITEPTYISGNYTGNPTFTVLGTRIQVTGISVSPGSFISIEGITAYNPQSTDMFDVYISIASDSNGLFPRNLVHIIATPTEGSVTISAKIEAKVGTLRISGQTSPGMFVTFVSGGTMIGTSTADSSGQFSQVFPGIPPVVHTVKIFGTDLQNRVTPSVTIEVLARAYEVTTVSGLVLPPTLSLDKDSIMKGEVITASGHGVPAYKAIVFTESPLQSYETVVDSDGLYSYTFTDTSNMELGEHKVYSLIQDNVGSQSLMSYNSFFQVVDNQTPDDGDPAACDISRGDLNCDQTVDLLDFSLLLYYWGSRSAVADVNGDGNVNLLDFSIMMFYWQG